MVTFHDEAGRDAYLPHPKHAEFVALLLGEGILDGAKVRCTQDAQHESPRHCNGMHVSAALAAGIGLSPSACSHGGLLEIRRTPRDRALRSSIGTVRFDEQSFTIQDFLHVSKTY